MFVLAILVCAAGCLWLDAPALAETECANAANPVVCENALPGDPQSDWQVEGIGDPTIQGYATSMSVNVGETVNFKIKTPASSYHIDILRLGYYQGNGARKIASNIQPTAKLPQTQPECLQHPSTGLIDCGNWSVSASWTVPKNAVSGMYIAHLVRNDTGGSSQIPFVVRNDSSHSEVLLQTSDETWEAYNAYGGNSLYGCTVACPESKAKAYKGAYSVSYNRPFDGGRQITGKDPEEIIRYFGAEKIWKIHFRNVSSPLPRFVETFMDNGYYDMYKIMKALRDVNFDGIVILDHSPNMVGGAMRRPRMVLRT